MLKFLWGILLAGVLVGCGKNEFMLNFSLGPEITENYDATYYATAKTGGLTIQAVASIMKGKCELKGVTKLPTLVYLTSRNSKFPLIIYVEKGDNIMISGENPDPLSWKVEGNELNLKLSEWRISNLQRLQRGTPEEVNKIVADFIHENNSDPVSLILLLCYFKRSAGETQYVELLNELSGIKKRDKWITMAARADQMTLSAALPAKIESMVMRSAAGGTDTIMFKDKNPAILIFWQNDLQNRKEIMDSLKILTKEFADSASRVIADINLDPDSIVWKNSLRRDTIKNVARLWAPAGLADQAVTKLQVATIPYIIVFDPQGHQIYRGSFFKDATSSFRKAYNKKDTIKS